MMADRNSLATRSADLSGAGTTHFRNLFRELLVFLAQAGVAIGVIIGLLLASFFPRDTDRPLSTAEAEAARRFYTTAYETQKNIGAVSPEDAKYAAMAAAAAERVHLRDELASFASRFGLTRKKILEIGAGQGYLQDVVADYVGLDISPTAARYYHKPYVVGSATAMPFADNSFDGAWSVAVFEHVPNPESGFRELRRVLKNGAVVFLAPTWECTSWAADGYDVRPFSDFGWKGKLAKVSIPVRITFRKASDPLVRAVLRNPWRQGPTTFHYLRLNPNFQNYWESDSDAVNSLDFYETALWFTSRGDECLNCDAPFPRNTPAFAPLLIRIRKH